MRLRSISMMVMVAVGAMGLTGCALLRPAVPGCEARHIKGSEWDVGGIKLPFNSSAIGTIEVAKVKYFGPQAQELSDAVSAMDIARQSLCAVINNDSFKTLPANYRADKFDKLIAINGKIVEVGLALSTAKTPEEGAAAAAAGRQAVKEVVEKPSPPVTPAAVPATAPAPAASGESIPAAPKAGIDETVRKDVSAMKTQIETLSADVAALRTTGATRLKVTGFASDGVSLPAEQRAVIAADVRAAMAQIPASRTPNVLVIGYADSQGTQNYNVAIGLRRAEVVAQILRKQDFGRAFHTEVTSGGVFSQGEGAEARKVEIVVS